MQLEMRRDGGLKGVPGTEGSLGYHLRYGFLILVLVKGEMACRIRVICSVCPLWDLFRSCGEVLEEETLR